MNIDTNLQPQEIIDTEMIVSVIENHTINEDLLCGCGLDLANMFDEDDFFVNEPGHSTKEQEQRFNESVSFLNRLWNLHQAEEIAKYFNTRSSS